MNKRLPSLLLLGTLGCSSGAPRFSDAPVVWHADDRHDIPEPQERVYTRVAYWLDVYGMRRLTRVTEVRGKTPAQNTNALDEALNSTWFTNRIGVRPVSADEAVLASSQAGPPKLPLVALGGKGGGTRPGFIAEDASGRKFLVKFDFAANPDQQTGTGVVANRIFWTIGFNVPGEHWIDVRQDVDVHVGPEAQIKDELGRKRPLLDEDIRAMFATAPRRADGTYRLFVSELLEGVPIGGASPEGRRRDDANDTIAHEHRRELRGMRVFAAWLGHTDIKEDNTLDMYVTEGDVHFVRHYLVDVNECFGTHQSNMGRLEDGWEHNVDWEMQLAALLALGLWKRPWEDQRQTPWPQLGAFAAEQFEPERWRPAFPYFPFFETTPADAYWAAKIVMRFDRELLEALVATAGWDPAPSAYLVDTLLKRARKIGVAYIDSVTPLDAFHFEGSQLCAHDLSIHYGLATEGTVRRIDPRGEVIEDVPVGPDGKVCWDAGSSRYTVDRLQMRRAAARRAKPAMELHYRGGQQARVLGIIRRVR